MLPDRYTEGRENTNLRRNLLPQSAQNPENPQRARTAEPQRKQTCSSRTHTAAGPHLGCHFLKGNSIGARLPYQTVSNEEVVPGPPTKTGLEVDKFLSALVVGGMSVHKSGVSIFRRGGVLRHTRLPPSRWHNQRSLTPSNSQAAFLEGERGGLNVHLTPSARPFVHTASPLPLTLGPRLPPRKELPLG